MDNQKRIVLAGGTGFIGRHLQAFYKQLGYEVIVISRKGGGLQWEDKAGIQASLEGATLVVNLAGKSVDCRYTAKNKALIFSSRLETTRILGELIKTCQRPPKLWINSSSATIYRHAEDRPMTEQNGEVAEGFSVEVVKAWEKAFFEFNLPNTRQAAFRISIVLGRAGGALPPYTRLAKWGVGGKQGTGRQRFSWIHMDDLVGAIRFVENSELEGIFNLAAPEAVLNTHLMKLLRLQVGCPIGIPAPAGLLKVAAAVIGTSSELLLKSRWVYPAALLDNGFVFKYPTLKEALKELLSK